MPLPEARLAVPAQLVLHGARPPEQEVYGVPGMPGDLLQIGRELLVAYLATLRVKHGLAKFRPQRRELLEDRNNAARALKSADPSAEIPAQQNERRVLRFLILCDNV